MKITAQQEYSFKVHDIDPSIDGNLNPKIINETWKENVYKIESGDFWDTNVFVDLGANIGAVSLWVDSFNKKRDNKITVIAVEPQQDNIELLKENWNNNPTESELILVEKAVWYKNEWVTISAQGANSNIISGNGLKVQTITLEQILELVKAKTGKDGIDVLKCDIESAEYDLILNTPNEVLNKIHYITMETDATNTDKWGKIVQKLSENFHITTLGAASRGTYIYAHRY